jgi:hypothetical protein
VAHALRRRVDDNEYDENGDGPYDKRYPRRMKVIADRGRVRVPMYMTDGMPNWMPQATFDASAHRPHCAVLDTAEFLDAQRRDRAYEGYVRGLKDQWRGVMAGPGATYWGGEDDEVGNGPDGEDGDDAEAARQAWIERMSSAWQQPTARFDLDHYARSVWAAQNAITGGSPEAAAQVEATQRRMSMSQPGATAASVGAERRRLRPHDAAALADKGAAYEAYCRRIENEWR